MKARAVLRLVSVWVSAAYRTQHVARVGIVLWTCVYVLVQSEKKYFLGPTFAIAQVVTHITGWMYPMSILQYIGGQHLSGQYID